MRSVLLILVVCILSFPALGQSDLPIDIEAAINWLDMNEAITPEMKYAVSGRTGEISFPNGSGLKAQIELNPLRAKMLSLLGTATNWDGFRLTLGSIKFDYTNRQAHHRTYIDFAIRVGDSIYECKLFDGIGDTNDARILTLHMPEQIRIPIDRARIAVLKFEDKFFLQSSGTFALEAAVSVESAFPEQRKTRRR